MKQIEVKFDAKAKDVLANTLDLGGSSIIEVPANSRITLNGNKLLQLLIAKGVDVDAEIDFYSHSEYSGILLGCFVSLNDYLSSSVYPHTLCPYLKSSGYHIKWSLKDYSDLDAEKVIDDTDALTIKYMLSNIGTLTIPVYSSGYTLIPYVALKTSSEANTTQVDITTDEFLSFITIIPANEQTEE